MQCHKSSWKKLEPHAAATVGPGVVLIREDCRLHDNPALHTAAEMHEWVVPQQQKMESKEVI